jgi:hypothetical protein
MPHLRGELEFGLFGAAPLLLAAASVYVAIGPAANGWHHAIDFHTFWTGGHAYLHGHSPYPTAAEIEHPGSRSGQFFVYPAPMAALFAPLALLPFGVAAVIFVACSTAAIIGALWLLDVRDWRCYGAAFLSPAVTTSITVGTLTPVLVLGIALLWRYRDRMWAAAAVTGLLLVAKLFLWPVLLWLLLTRRARTAARALILAAAGCVLAWLPLGFGSLTAYPALLRTLSLREGPSSYQPLWLAPGSATSRLLLLELAAGACVALVLTLGRRLSERASLGACVIVALAVSPIVWLHYLALLAPVAALVSRRVSVAWLAPLALWATPWQLSGGVAWRVVIAAAVVAAAAFSPTLPLRGIGRPARRAA